MSDQPVEPRILIIDDDLVDRTAVKRYLGQSSRHRTTSVIEAETGAEALEILSRTPDFDCIFLDYLLPDMDGIHFLEKIYDRDKDLASSPIVMLTGQGNEAIMLEALRWGVQDYLVKDNITADTINIAVVKAKEIFDLKTQRRKAEDQLYQAQKMEAVGQLTSGIAHDFNNLLTIVLGNTRLLRKKMSGERGAFSLEEASGRVESIESAAHKGADLVKRLMVFTRQRPLTQDIVNINNCITETISLLQRTLGSGIEINVHADENLWPVQIDPTQFENVLINLAINARDAMNSEGRLTIETHNVFSDEAYSWTSGLEPGAYVLVAMSDTGSGMSKEVMRRIFEPFYTTKPIGKGTGLGLSMVYGFVQQSGGYIRVYSEEGHGSVFRIYLPRWEQTEPAEIVPEKTVPGGGEIILVTEDEDDVRHTAVTMLQSLGYKTLQAKDGPAAIEILNAYQDRIDLLFTDIVMPGGMTGIELAQKAKTINPDLHVLYTSGYTENAIPDYQLNPGEHLLSKPYRKESLALKLRAALSDRTSYV